MRIPTLLGICLLLAGLVHAQQLPTMAPTPGAKQTTAMPLMSEEEKQIGKNPTPSPTSTPPPAGWQNASPTVSGPVPPAKQGHK